MRKVLLVFTCLILSLISTYSQADASKLNYSLGGGVLFFGRGDILCSTLENEASYKFLKYLSTSVCLLNGRSANASNGLSYNTFTQLELNLFVSIPSYDWRNNLRIGSGPTYNYMNRMRSYYGYYENDTETQSFHEIGFNVIVEDTYDISSKIFVGTKCMLHFEGARNQGWGLFLKAGIHLL